MSKDNRVEVFCELKRTSQTKKSSLDQEYQMLFVTNDPRVMDLGKLPYDTMFKVSVEIVHE